jgi:hypothetical protein
MLVHDFLRWEVKSAKVLRISVHYDLVVPTIRWNYHGSNFERPESYNRAGLNAISLIDFEVGKSRGLMKIAVRSTLDCAGQPDPQHIAGLWRGWGTAKLCGLRIVMAIGIEP